jgi:class 3 adenylate cyclase
MQQIADWLESLGMSEYGERFAENRIDFSVLPDLTDQDLKELGVLLGDRRKILRAIAKLDAASETAAPPAKPSSSLTAATVEPLTIAQGRSERHLVTVMLCDLVDFNAEEPRDWVGAFFDASSAAVTDMGGTVAKRLGFEIVALFGHPAAQENGSERAVRAALATQRALTELNRINDEKSTLAARIVIDLASVTINEAGEIFGDLPNVVAQTQALAEPGEVVVTAQVQRQVAGLFTTEERGSHQFKGVRETVTLYRIIEETSRGHSKSSYDRLIARAVSGLETNTLEARKAVYERARKGLMAQLRFNQPALSTADITNDRLLLEEAIRRVEIEAARNSQTEEPIEPRPPPPTASRSTKGVKGVTRASQSPATATAYSHGFEPDLYWQGLWKDGASPQESDLELVDELEEKQPPPGLSLWHRVRSLAHAGEYERALYPLSYGSLIRLLVVLVILAASVAAVSWQWPVITELYQFFSHTEKKPQNTRKTPSAQSKPSGLILQQGNWAGAKQRKIVER